MGVRSFLNYNKRFVDRGQAAIEAMLWLAIFLSAALIAQRYFKAAIMGRWKTVADTYGFGRQYEEGKTIVGER